jgi:hypothetical protein
LVRDRRHSSRVRRRPDTVRNEKTPQESRVSCGVSDQHALVATACQRTRGSQWKTLVLAETTRTSVMSESDGPSERQSSDGETLRLLAPEPSGLARGLDRRLLDRGDRSLELVGVGRADPDEAGYA